MLENFLLNSGMFGLVKERAGKLAELENEKPFEA